MMMMMALFCLSKRTSLLTHFFLAYSCVHSDEVGRWPCGGGPLRSLRHYKPCLIY